MLENIKAAIFDLDGTLVDSMWMWKDIDSEYLKKYHINPPDSLHRDIEGMGFTENAVYFKETFSLPGSLDDIKAEWVAMAYEKYANHVPLKSGARNFLTFLMSKHIQLGIATSNARNLAEAALNHHGITPLFGSIITACDVAKGKPSPDIYLKAAADLDVAPDQCIVFEDIPMGILAGKNAGMRVCAVFDEYSKDLEQEKKSLADYYITSYDDILTNKFEVL